MMFASDPLSTPTLDPASTDPVEDCWSFLAELDAGLDPAVLLNKSQDIDTVSTNTQLQQNHDAVPVSTESMQKLTALERKQEKNRLAQKRFRQRKKERSTSTEAQLAETTTQLHNLKLRQRELEARNTLLEQLAKLNKQQKLQQGSHILDNMNDLLQDDAKAVLSNFTEVMEGSAVVLTVYGHKQLMAMEEFATLSVTDFAKLYTAYTRKQAQCLVEIADMPDSPSLASLQRWSLEITAMFTCLTVTNPRVMDTLAESSMDGSSQTECFSDKHYDDMLAALDFTPSQTQDLLQLRRLLYGTAGQLLRERQALLDRMSAAEEKAQLIMSQPVKLGFCHAIDALGEMTQIAEQLSTNAMADRRAYKMFSSAFFRGIQTSKQHAVSMVHPYPFLMNATKQLEALAREHQEPSIQTLMESGGIDDLQHAANWEAVVKYVQTFDASNSHCHHPFLHDDADHAVHTAPRE